MNKIRTIVMKFIVPLLKQGRTVWMDKYNSPKLVRSLKRAYQTDCIRMLKLNRKNVLKKVKDAKFKKEGMIS
jgi:hypothetical protein